MVNSVRFLRVQNPVNTFEIHSQDLVVLYILLGIVVLVPVSMLCYQDLLTVRLAIRCLTHSLRTYISHLYYIYERPDEHFPYPNGFTSIEGPPYLALIFQFS